MVCRMTTAGEPGGSSRGLPSSTPACSPAAHPLSSPSDASVTSRAQPPWPRAGPQGPREGTLPAGGWKPASPGASVMEAEAERLDLLSPAGVAAVMGSGSGRCPPRMRLHAFPAHPLRLAREAAGPPPGCPAAEG